MSYRFADSSQTISKPVWHIPLLCVQWKTPDDGQRNCPKHVEFCSKNKYETLVHLLGLIIRIYHDARSSEHQIHFKEVKSRQLLTSHDSSLSHTSSCLKPNQTKVQLNITWGSWDSSSGRRDTKYAHTRNLAEVTW